jgi:hypothetical protein
MPRGVNSSPKVLYFTSNGSCFLSPGVKALIFRLALYGLRGDINISLLHLIPNEMGNLPRSGMQLDPSGLKHGGTLSNRMTSTTAAAVEL